MSEENIPLRNRESISSRDQESESSRKICFITLIGIILLFLTTGIPALCFFNFEAEGMANRNENAFTNTENFIENVCDPTGLTNLTNCSFSCFDSDFENRFEYRVGTYLHGILFLKIINYYMN
jgi:hypothetical protein